MVRSREKIILWLLGAGVVVVIAAVVLRAYWQIKREAHIWHITVARESGGGTKLAWDARRPVEELSDALFKAIQPMFAGATPPQEGHRVLGTIAYDYSYTTDVEWEGNPGSLTTSVNQKYLVLLMATGGCDLATEEEISRGRDYHTIQMPPDASRAPDIIAGYVAREIHQRAQQVLPPSGAE